MSLTDKEKRELFLAFNHLTIAQQQWIMGAILAFSVPHDFQRAPDSDLITQTVLENLGDRLLSHHASSRQALSKDRFEFALESALNDSKVPKCPKTNYTIAINLASHYEVLARLTTTPLASSLTDGILQNLPHASISLRRLSNRSVRR